MTDPQPDLFEPMTGADRARLWRERHPGADKRRRKGNRRSRAPRNPRPFCGCDGEGAGADDFGRQNYMLFRMGERELFTGHRLSTAEILAFICDHPAEPILVGFAFGYDVTMILRDLSPDRRARLFAPKEAGEGHSRYVWYQGFGIEYLPRQYLRVCSVHEGRAMKGSSRTIYETFGFFQMSFVRALQAFEIGTERLADIQRMKDARADFGTIGDDVREYCALECRYLADMLEKLRHDCTSAGIFPRSWNGAGKLASALHDAHKTMLARDVPGLVPAAVLEAAGAAYYGGRFETTRAGMVAVPVYEYDIRSAYPAAMATLPCLQHGTWRSLTRAELRDPPAGLYVARVGFTHAAGVPLCGLPVRRKGGYICWPCIGAGTYWSVEIDAARGLGCRPVLREGWAYERRCDCAMFPWVEPLYEYRRRLGSSGEGYPIKLGINSLYGKLAQRIGNGKFANLIWAGLITATTRARLMQAAASDPGAVVMLATDGIYSTRPLAVEIGDRLGQWEANAFESLFIVQPGLYWGPPAARRKRKTRGISPKFFESRTGDFEIAWERWREYDQSASQNAMQNGWTPPPTVAVDVELFIGLRLAQARGKPETAGKWVRSQRNIRFDWSRKRGSYRWDGSSVITSPLIGGTDWLSVAYVQVEKGNEIWDGAKEDLEDQPDYIDLSNPME